MGVVQHKTPEEVSVLVNTSGVDLILSDLLLNRSQGIALRADTSLCLAAVY